MPHDLSPDAARWAERGSVIHLAGHDIFVADIPAADPSSGREPLLVLHGFPTSSYDIAGVVDQLAADRRVIAPDFLGFGLSAKPDLHYTMGLQADVVVALTAELGLDRIALLTHDMGDTVGGELLARHIEGSWPVEITRRVVTNGSIYIESAHLTDGQQFLLALPDEQVAEGLGPTPPALAASLLATLSPGTTVPLDELVPHGELICVNDGSRLLPRTIRYIEERRANERRFTGAIESHPSPLAVVWGVDDPIAVVGMTDTLAAARPDLHLTLLDGVGHYPMVEAPDRYTAAVLAALDA
ncbi:MAG: alpha/beta hydrolase [Acidimicrobiales bacterium]